jgi:putative transposase
LWPTSWAGRLDKIMATRKRHSPEQIVRRGGVPRAQFGGLKAEDAKRLKELERENATLKRLLADAELEKVALKEIAKGNF